MNEGRPLARVLLEAAATNPEAKRKTDALFAVRLVNDQPSLQQQQEDARKKAFAVFTQYKDTTKGTERTAGNFTPHEKEQSLSSNPLRKGSTAVSKSATTSVKIGKGPLSSSQVVVPKKLAAPVTIPTAEQLSSAPRFGVNARAMILQAAAQVSTQTSAAAAAAQRKPLAPGQIKPRPTLARLNPTKLLESIPPAERPMIQYVPRSSIPRLMRQGCSDTLLGQYLVMLMEGCGQSYNGDETKAIQALKSASDLKKVACAAAAAHENSLYKQVASKAAYSQLSSKAVTTRASLHQHAGTDLENLLQKHSRSVGSFLNPSATKAVVPGVDKPGAADVQSGHYAVKQLQQAATDGDGGGCGDVEDLFGDAELADDKDDDHDEEGGHPQIAAHLEEGQHHSQLNGSTEPTQQHQDTSCAGGTVANNGAETSQEQPDTRQGPPEAAGADHAGPTVSAGDPQTSIDAVPDRRGGMGHDAGNIQAGGTVHDNKMSHPDTPTHMQDDVGQTEAVCTDTGADAPTLPGPEITNEGGQAVLNHDAQQTTEDHAIQSKDTCVPGLKRTILPAAHVPSSEQQEGCNHDPGGGSDMDMSQEDSEYKPDDASAYMPSTCHDQHETSATSQSDRGRASRQDEHKRRSSRSRERAKDGKRNEKRRSRSRSRGRSRSRERSNSRERDPKRARHTPDDNSGHHSDHHNNHESRSDADKDNAPALTGVAGQVAEFVRGVLDPLYRARLLTKDTYKDIVKRSVSKIMSHHPDATNASFLLREHESVRRYVMKLVEASAKVNSSG